MGRRLGGFDGGPNALTPLHATTGRVGVTAADVDGTKIATNDIAHRAITRSTISRSVSLVWESKSGDQEESDYTTVALHTIQAWTPAQALRSKRARGKHPSAPEVRPPRSGLTPRAELLPEFMQLPSRSSEHLLRTPRAVALLSSGGARILDYEAKLALSDLVRMIVSAAGKASCRSDLDAQEQRPRPGHQPRRSARLACTSSATVSSASIARSSASVL